MKLICRLAGHKPSQYSVLTKGIVDGISRMHSPVISLCARCGEQFKVTTVHLPESVIIKESTHD